MASFMSIQSWQLGVSVCQTARLILAKVDECISDWEEGNGEGSEGGGGKKRQVHIFPLFIQ